MKWFSDTSFFLTLPRTCFFETTFVHPLTCFYDIYHTLIITHIGFSSLSANLAHRPYDVILVFFDFVFCCPLLIAFCTPLFQVDFRSLWLTWSPFRRGYFHIEIARFVLSIFSFKASSSSAWMSALSFVGSPQCAFALTKNVAVLAYIPFRSKSIASHNKSAFGEPTKVALPLRLPTCLPHPAVPDYHINTT